MMAEDYDEEERAIIDALRKRRGREESKLPVYTTEDLAQLLRAKVGLGPLRTQQTLTRLGLITQRATGPLVKVDGTLTELKQSWAAHYDHLIRTGASAPVIRQRREALANYCKATGLDWWPRREAYERRAMAAREKANELVELPEDFLELLDSVIRDVQYSPDPATQAMYQTAIRLDAKTGGRIPSELCRLRLQDVQASRGIVVYRQSKIAGPEGDAVLIPREVFDVAPSVLSAHNRITPRVYVETYRPIQEARALAMHGEAARTSTLFLGPRGLPVRPEKFRLTVSERAKTVWPDFHPYKLREIAIIMRALEDAYEYGHIDHERLIQWSGHEDFNNLRGYLRSAKTLLRSAAANDDLSNIIHRWREI